MTLLLLLRPCVVPTLGGIQNVSGEKRYRKVIKRCKRWVVSKFPGLQCKEELEEFKRLETQALERHAKVMQARWEDEEIALVAAIIEEEEGI